MSCVSDFRKSNPSSKQTKYLIIKNNKIVDIDSSTSDNKRQIKSHSQLHKIDENPIEQHFQSKSMIADENIMFKNESSSLDKNVSVEVEWVTKKPSEELKYDFPKFKIENKGINNSKNLEESKNIIYEREETQGADGKLRFTF